jgi:TM2 domain-containing membrane protein YozV
VIYCEDCLAATLGLPGPAPAATGVPPTVENATPYGGAPQNPYATPGYAPPGTPVNPGAPIAPGTARQTSNPSIAFILGFFPGLGAVYNGEYNKALIHIVIFAAMIAGLNSDLGDGATTALALLLAGFIFYMAIDAMRSAKARNQGLPTADPMEIWSKDRPVGPIILIGLGVIFLLNSFSWFPFYRMQRLWPLILIAAGALMFRNRIDRSL